MEELSTTGCESPAGVATPLSRGHEFLRKFGNPRYVVAPMVDQSDLAFRMLTRKYGATLTFTQMFNAPCFLTSKEFQESFTVSPEDRPLICQFAGHTPDEMLRAALMVQDKCDAIDVNLGCPQDIARRGRYGAFLMEDLDLLTQIVSTLSKGLRVLVTCKTRIYKDFDRTIRLCETLVNAGACILTIHGRTREEKGHKVCEADWDMIRRIKAHFGNRVPIIANGGISCLEDAERCMKETGVDAVMTSEAILENPALFSRRLDSEGKLMTHLDLAEEYLHFCNTKYPTPMKSVRSHLMKMLHRYLTKHTNIRDLLAMSKKWSEFDDVCAHLRKLIPTREDDDLYQDTWYDRHRNIAWCHAGRMGTGANGPLAMSLQQLKIDSSTDKLWVREGEDFGEGGIFSSLGMGGEEDYY